MKQAQNQDNPNPTIKYILVVPRNKRYCSYHINDNIRDKHSMKYEDLYLFISSMLKPPSTAILHELIYSYKHIFVDVLNNTVVELDPKAEKYHIDIKEFSFQKIEKEMKEDSDNKNNFLKKTHDKMEKVILSQISPKKMEQDKKNKDKIKNKFLSSFF